MTASGRLGDQYIAASSLPQVPRFHCLWHQGSPKADFQVALEISLLQIVCKWHWPGEHEARVASRCRSHQRRTNQTSRLLESGWCLEAFLTCCRMCLSLNVISSSVEALPVHRGMPEREWYAPNDKHLGSSSKIKRDQQSKNIPGGG